MAAPNITNQARRGPPHNMGPVRLHNKVRPWRQIWSERASQTVCTESSATGPQEKAHQEPAQQANLPEGWTPPQAPDDTLDPRAVGSPALVADMLKACGTVGRRQGPRFQAFYGCMFYALMRPSEVAALTKASCHLPETGWGHLTFADASPAAGRAYTDDGQVHEHRGLKGRTKGRPAPHARRPVRKVPIPPQLVELLRIHIATYGTAPDGRLFRSETGNPIQPSTWWQVW